MFNITWGDLVRVKEDAPASMRPGSVAEVVGIREIETHEQARQFGAAIGGKVYLIEFGNGDAVEVPASTIETCVP